MTRRGAASDAREGYGTATACAKNRRHAAGVAKEAERSGAPGSSLHAPAAPLAQLHPTTWWRIRSREACAHASRLQLNLISAGRFHHAIAMGNRQQGSEAQRSSGEGGRGAGKNGAQGCRFRTDLERPQWRTLPPHPRRPRSSYFGITFFTGTSTDK